MESNIPRRARNGQEFNFQSPYFHENHRRIWHGAKYQSNIKRITFLIHEQLRAILQKEELVTFSRDHIASIEILNPDKVLERVRASHELAQSSRFTSLFQKHVGPWRRALRETCWKMWKGISFHSVYLILGTLLSTKWRTLWLEAKSSSMKCIISMQYPTQNSLFSPTIRRFGEIFCYFCQ